MAFGVLLQGFVLAASQVTRRAVRPLKPRSYEIVRPGFEHSRMKHEGRRQEPRISAAPMRTGRSSLMSRGELYEYYQRIGLREVYFGLFPGG